MIPIRKLLETAGVDPWQRWELNLIRHQRTQRDRRLLPGAGRAQIRKRVFLDTQ